MSDGTGAPATFLLSFRKIGGCLEVRATGRLESVEAIALMLLGIGGELRRSGARQSLILDETRSVVPDATQFEQLVTGLAHQGFEGVRTAFVDVHGGSLERIEVGEIIARRHGYVLRAFDNEYLARLWLRYVPE